MHFGLFYNKGGREKQEITHVSVIPGKNSGIFLGFTVKTTYI